MNSGKYVYLVYQKDFAEKGNDRYFLYDGSAFSEASSLEVVSLDCFVVTHDFWLISNSLYKKHKRIPSNVVDVVLLSKIVAGKKSKVGNTQPWDISETIKPLYKNVKDFEDYVSMYYRRESLDESTYMLFSHKLADYTGSLLSAALEAREHERFFSLEMPVYNVLVSSACKGFRVCKDTIKNHKQNLKLDFYRELKNFSKKHNVLYEIPNEGEIKEKLSKLGYDIKDYSLEFLIDFLPSHDGYTDDLRHLQKTEKNYHIFNSISSSKERISPIVESHWTSTARIYHKSPSIQNISKRYRDIFIADEGLSLCYVDYDQFEVGIMAALSDDPKMKEIYSSTDAYRDLAEKVFENSNYRKKAKILFLSYTYGMSLNNLISAVSQQGGDHKKAKEYFSEFSVFENWRTSICNQFQDKGYIATICANYLRRQKSGELSDKEKRTAVNHVIQGSATYIFKRALFELSKLNGVDILIPMHDAVLFQHAKNIDPRSAVKIFEDIMTINLEYKIKGKASIEEFYSA